MDFALSSLRDSSAIPEESEPFLDENQRFLADSKKASFPLDYGVQRREVWRFLSQTWVLYCNLVLLICCFVLLGGASIHLASRDSDRGRNAMLKKTSFYCKSPSLPLRTSWLIRKPKAPVFNWVDIPTKPIQFNRTLFRQDPPSLYRMPPSPEVDAAWYEISVLGAIAITAEDVDRIGKDSSKSVRAPAS